MGYRQGKVGSNKRGGSYPVERADDLSTSGPVRRFHRKLFLGLIALPLLWATPTGAEELASYAIGPGAMFAAPSLSRVAANNQDRPAPVSEPAVASLEITREISPDGLVAGADGQSSIQVPGSGGTLDVERSNRNRPPVLIPLYASLATLNFLDVSERMWRQGRRKVAIAMVVGLTVANALVVRHNYMVGSSLR